MTSTDFHLNTGMPLFRFAPDGRNREYPQYLDSDRFMEIR